MKEGETIMDFISKIRGDSDLADLLSDACDVEIFSEFQVPQDEFGHIVYNIPGKTFATHFEQFR